MINRYRISISRAAQRLPPYTFTSIIGAFALYGTGQVRAKLPVNIILCDPFFSLGDSKVVEWHPRAWSAAFREPLTCRILRAGDFGPGAAVCPRTLAWAEVLQLLGFALGGEAGARTAAALGLTGSPGTLLAHLRRHDADPAPTPRVTGVDDFTFRKGDTTGPSSWTRNVTAPSSSCRIGGRRRCLPDYSTILA